MNDVELKTKLEKVEAMVDRWETTICRCKALIEEQEEVMDQLRTQIREVRGERCDCFSIGMHDTCNHN